MAIDCAWQPRSPDAGATASFTIPIRVSPADVRSQRVDSLCSPRAAAPHRARPARAAPRRARGEPRAPPRAARRGPRGGRRPRRVPGARADRLPAPGPRRRGRDAPRRPAPGDARAPRRDGLSAVVSFVEESGDHRLFIAAALLEDGEIRHVHRKVFLPTYGLFDERRFFAAGRRAPRDAVAARAWASGIAVCEDFWHLATPQLLALDGAQILINVSSSPGRDLAATQRGRARDGDVVADADADVRAADDVVRGVREPRRASTSRSRSGAARRSSRPSGEPRVLGAVLRRGPVPRRRRPRRTSAASGSRCRCCATSGPSSRSRELARIIAERAGLAPTRPPSQARAGLDVAPERRRRRSEPIGSHAGATATGDAVADCRSTTPAGRCSSCPTSWRSTPTSRAGSSPSSSAASCARRASSAACSGCRAGSTRRSSRTSSPRRSAPSSCCAC